MSDAARLQIREPALEFNSSDAQFITSAFDSTLAHLESIGSGAQWGSKPFSSKEGFCDRIREWTDKSTQDGKPVRLFIAELKQADPPPSLGNLHHRVDGDGNTIFLLGAALVADAWAPEYILKACEEEAGLDGLRKTLEAKDYSYLEVLITDFRGGVGGPRKGAGAALLERVREYVVQAGRRTLLADCWAGNERGLVR